MNMDGIPQDAKRWNRRSVRHVANPLILGCLIAVLMACREQTPKRKLDADTLASYASLPLLKQASHHELQQELQRLRSEHATPEALAAPEDTALLPDGRHPTRDSRVRSTRALVELLPLSQRQQWLEEMEREFPRAALVPDPSDLAAYRQLARRWEKVRTDAETILARADFGLYVPIDQGLLSDLSFVDVVRGLVRLECLNTALAVLEHDLARGLVAWSTAGRWIDELSRMPHAVTRVAAARARVEWLRTGQSLLQSPLAHHETFATVLSIVESQLEDWPADRQALIGDRAVGLHTYELLRAGYWMSLLTKEELTQLRRRRQAEALAVHVATRLDDDEAFYLRAMRRLIEQSELPYPRRHQTYQAIEKEFRSLSGTTSYPWFAAEFLLPDVEHLLRWQATDRELAQALRWTIRIAMGEEPPESLRGPRSDREWHWQPQEKPPRVVLPQVQWPIDDTPIELPRLTAP